MLLLGDDAAGMLLLSLPVRCLKLSGRMDQALGCVLATPLGVQQPSRRKWIVGRGPSAVDNRCEGRKGCSPALGYENVLWACNEVSVARNTFLR
jgi:hypothetical protein